MQAAPMIRVQSTSLTTIDRHCLPGACVRRENDGRALVLARACWVFTAKPAYVRRRQRIDYSVCLGWSAANQGDPSIYAITTTAAGVNGWFIVLVTLLHCNVYLTISQNSTADTLAPPSQQRMSTDGTRSLEVLACNCRDGSQQVERDGLRRQRRVKAGSAAVQAYIQCQRRVLRRCRYISSAYKQWPHSVTTKGTGGPMHIGHVNSLSIVFGASSSCSSRRSGDLACAAASDLACDEATGLSGGVGESSMRMAVEVDCPGWRERGLAGSEVLGVASAVVASFPSSEEATDTVSW